MLFEMKRLLAVLAAWAVVVACTPSGTTPDTSASASAAVAKPAINEQTRGEIQALLQRQHDTVATRDQKTFEATIDPERRAPLKLRSTRPSSAM